MKPVALILAGFDKPDVITQRRRKKEISESYGGEEIYIGKNKFLYKLKGKPVLQYVIDAVSHAKIDGKNIYKDVYVYNDVEGLSKAIDNKQYPNLHLKQMKGSVGGNWKEFYQNEIDYGQRVDVFFGDTPRLEAEDIVFLHKLYNNILGKEKDHKGDLIRMVFGIVDAKDLHDNWLEYRLKYIKRGKHKGKLKGFVGFKDFQARVGNSGGIIKHKCIDGLMDKEAVNLLYNIRKALTPRSFSKIMYHIWKTKHFDLVKEIKNKCITQEKLSNAITDILAGVYKLDLTGFAATNVRVTKNASRWENDIDGPIDLEIFKDKMV